MNERPQPTSSGRRYGGLLLSVLVLVAAVLVVFGGVCRHEFLMYDDEPHLVNNPRLNPVTWSNVGLFWVEKSYWGLYIPLSYTFFAAEAAMAGQPLDPTVFHLGNLALHVACVLLVFTILRRLFRHDGAACAGALLFGLHPVQVESVAWISETRGLLCAVFSLLAIWQFDLWSAGTSKSGKSTALCYGLATAAFILALLSKPAAVALPLIVGVLALGLVRRPWRRILLGLSPWVFAAAGWVVLTKLQQPSGQMAFVPPVWTRPLIAGDALAFYLYELLGPLWYVLGLIWRALLVPWDGLEPLASWAKPHLYGPDYGRTPAWVIGQRWFYLTWILPAGLLVVLACLRNRRLWLTAAGVFIAWLVPVLGLLPFDFQRISTVADRYLYLSLLGPALALSWLLARRWNFLTIGITASILGLFGVLSFMQTAPWRDNASLIAHGLRVNPRSVLARQHQGVLLNRKGEHEEAIKWYQEALRIDPRHEDAYNNLANSWLVLEQVDEAEKVLREAARQIPMRPPVHRSLADILVKQGKTLLKQGRTDLAQQRFDEAEQSYREAFRLDPDWSVPYWSLGKLRFDRGATDEAIGLYRKAVDVEPNDAQARVELGRALETLGKIPEALNHYQVALRIRPDCPRANFNLANLLMSQGAVEAAIWHYRAELEYYPKYARAHVNLGIALFEQIQIPEAIRHYREALRIDPDLMEAHLRLGHALAAQNRHQEAAAAYRAALQLVPSDSPQAEQIRKFLRPYENR